jgi:uncharacterized membrane protein YhaH (DUF805 family)
MKGSKLSATARLWWSLAALVLVAASPVLIALTAGLSAAMLGCQLDEGDIHPCPVLGVDIGGGLYMFGMLFWFAFFLVPIAAIGFLVWLGFAITLLVKRLRRSTPA